jgi:hypothetical protein
VHTHTTGPLEFQVNLWWQYYYYECISSCLPYIIQCVSLAGSPGKMLVYKKKKVKYICMSYL